MVSSAVPTQCHNWQKVTLNMLTYRESALCSAMQHWYGTVYQNAIPDRAPWVWAEMGAVLALPTRYHLGTPSVPIRAIPVGTGVGKSTCLRLFSLLHADSTNFLIASRLKEDCVLLKKDLDEMARKLMDRKLIARCPSVGIWSSEPKHRNPSVFADDILLCTHEMCRRAGGYQRLFQALNSGREDHLAPLKPEFESVEPGLRARRWISDEPYAISDDRRFNVERLAGVAQMLGDILFESDRMTECAREVGSTPDEMRAAVRAFQAVVAEVVAWGKDSSQSNFKPSFTADAQGVGKIVELLESDDSPRLLNQFSADGCKEATQLVQALQFVATNWAIKAGHGEKATVINTVPMLPLEAPGLWILDATAKHSAALCGLQGKYDVDFSPHLTAPSRQPRCYDQVRLHPVLLDDGSRRAIQKRLTREIIREVISKAREGVPDDASVLILTWKDGTTAVENLLRECGISNYELGHFGNHDRATNAYRDCAGVVLLGAFRLPNDKYEAMRLSHAGPTPTFEAYQVASQEARGYQNKDLVSSTIQAINRVRVRTVVDSDGRCARANVVLAVHANTWELLREPVLDSMPGIVIQPSVEMQLLQLAPRRQTTRKNNSSANLTERLLRHLQAEAPGALVGTTFNDLLDHVGAKTGHARRELRKQASDPATSLGQALRALGYETADVGRGGRRMTLQAAG